MSYIPQDDLNTSLERSFSILDPILPENSDAKVQGVLEDPEFYKKALSIEPSLSKKFHESLMNVLKPSEGVSASEFLPILIRTYWMYVSEISKQINKASLTSLFLVRFGVVSPKVLNQKERSILERIRWDNTTGESVHYMDEWLRLVSRGEVSRLETDEPLTKRSTEVTQGELNQRISKIMSQIEVIRKVIKEKENQQVAIENNMKNCIEDLSFHADHIEFEGIKSPYTDDQKRLFSQITADIKKLLNLNREIGIFISDLRRQTQEMKTIKDRYNVSSKGEGNSLDNYDLTKAAEEVETLARLARITVGPRGNQLPILLHNYFPYQTDLIGFRERVIQCLDFVEKLDPEIFRRSYRGNLSRIVPHFILIPSYGDRGVCWEPFERGKRSASKGRIALPIFGKDINLSVIRGLGDFRWEICKEVASFRWMEEGLTGWYYEWFYKNIKKGNIKYSFIEHYTLWILKESKGLQKLPKELRDIFWRYVPFPQFLKEELSLKSPIYKDLLQKDANRESSAGY